MPLETVTAKVKPLGAKLGVDYSKVDAIRSDNSYPDDFDLGYVEAAGDGNTYVRVEANGAIDAYAACALEEDGTIRELTTTISGSQPTTVVVPQVAIADTSRGWAVLKGTNFSVLAAASCAADVKVGTTATAGVIDDTIGDLIQGLRLTVANGGSQAATAASAPNGMLTNAQD